MPKEIWASQLATAHEALARAGIDAADIAAIGITNQRETTRAVEPRTGEPLHNAIVWQDRRAEPLCAQLRERGLEADGSRDRPASSSMRTSPAPRSVAARPRARRARCRRAAANWRSAPSTPGCCGSSPAAGCTPPTSATRRARCCSTSAHNRLGPELLQVAATSRRACCRRCIPSSHRLSARRDAALLGRRDPDRRHRRRPAERAVRPGLLSRRAGQEHLRHRLLHADAHRRSDFERRPTA